MGISNKLLFVTIVIFRILKSLYSSFKLLTDSQLTDFNLPIGYTTYRYSTNRLKSSKDLGF